VLEAGLEIARRAVKRNAAPRTPARLFVQIPAYRDSELAFTLLDLFAKAADPDLLRVVVLWQRGPHESLPPRVRRLPGLELIEVPHAASRGCNWARSLLQKQWRGEPYTLLLDSHHRFVQGWDEKALEMYHALVAKGIRRPLLTAYLPPYRPETEPYGRKRAPYKIYPLEWQNGMLLRLTSYPIPFWRRLNEPIPATFVSLHFLFADGAFNRDVPFDPHTYFVGDEVAMSVRCFTNGFELFHPHKILGWHCYDRGSRVTHWTDHYEWFEQNARSLKRLRRLFRGRLHGRHGIGANRTVSDYEERMQLELVRQVAP
jgi:hypothetical protein